MKEKGYDISGNEWVMETAEEYFARNADQFKELTGKQLEDAKDVYERISCLLRQATGG